ncbi:hypothetical protein GLE_3332 [Lysobacter enzymogenes]|uniref:Uncharacterized protein n=1 Tax=Lysobacter enzymogenes TaxID=69 RepID=A0A0S2DJ41_LYSEN|nr:DUF6484 domain-containing protein [Lysobacter enzymogenes]ALN58678.1 hypothetical protein GLE_3332 [Lysobacter enzymogenes]QCW26998.1 hypothetical protein FE772_16480 [Lysobacter enzymogenes]
MEEKSSPAFGIEPEYDADTASPLLAATAPAPLPAGAIVVGRVARVDADKTVWVAHAALPGRIQPARCAIEVHEEYAGREVVLAFEHCDPRRPIVLGLVWQPEAAAPLERVEICAGQEVVVRCGEASVTLTADGKILLRGAYISSHAKGTNRLKGGSVRMN